jgi:hypothetical protein
VQSPLDEARDVHATDDDHGSEPEETETPVPSSPEDPTEDLQSPSVETRDPRPNDGSNDNEQRDSDESE